MLYVARIDGELSPDWDPVIASYVAGGMTLRRDLGSAVYAAFINTDPRSYIAAFARGEYFFQILAPSKEDLRTIVADAMKLLD
jgi:hypothetical protein